jgi:hypothetical protein
MATTESGTLTYLLPIRGTPPGPALDELTTYLRWVARRAHVIIVDGSEPDLFALHATMWGFAEHVAPRREDRCLNGKAWGVRTGLRLARTRKVVIADDDVRYDAVALGQVAASLDRADLVRPQNYFDPMPWHAAWDTGRTLLNRSFAHDHPGTLGIDRDRYLARGGYDGDVLFENLQLARTVEAGGGIVVDRPDVFVPRRPPTTQRFIGQRVRQAYDDLAQPGRLLIHLSILPALIWATRRWGKRTTMAFAVVTAGVAELGRRRDGFDERVPARCSLLAPVWLMERAVCAWAAVFLRISGGCPYAGARIKRAADPPWRIRARPPVPPAARTDGFRHRSERSASGRTGRAPRPDGRHRPAAASRRG